MMLALVGEAMDTICVTPPEPTPVVLILVFVLFGWVCLCMGFIVGRRGHDLKAENESLLERIRELEDARERHAVNLARAVTKA